MSNFGQVLFSGSPLIRWTLIPVLFLCIVIFGFMTFASALDYKVTPALISLALTLGCISMSIALIFPNCGWAVRIVTGLVFAAYLTYLIYEWVFDIENGLGLGSRRGESNPINSLMGFVIIGLPCLWFTIFGRFTIRPETLIELDDSNGFFDEGESNEEVTEQGRPANPPKAEG